LKAISLPVAAINYYGLATTKKWFPALSSRRSTGH
jgi:hypothetical protein